MKNSCAGLVELSTPFSTRPGWVRHDSEVEVGTGEGVSVCVGVEVDGSGGIRVGVGGVDGEQAASNARSVKSIAIRFVRRSRIAWLIT